MGVEIQLPPGDTAPLVRSAILANPRQRRILSVLLDQPGPLTERDLAVQLAARETGKSPPDVTEEDRQQIRNDLHHRCIPKLEAAGWIERLPEGIVATERLSIESMGLSLPDLQGPDDLRGSDRPSWEALAVLLARPRRRDIVSIIADQQQPLTLKELYTHMMNSGRTSRALDRGEEPRGEEDRGEEEPTLLVTLHHVDLPKLQEVGLIEYDSDEKTVARKRSLGALLDEAEIGKQEE